MKKVKTEELFHLWAQGTTENLEARTTNASCRGRFLHSYREVIGARFPTVTYLSTYRFGNTTNKHQAEASRAAHGNVIRLDVAFPESWNSNAPQREFEVALADNCRHRANNIMRGLRSTVETARKLNKEILEALSTYESLLDFACTIDKGEPAQRFSTLEELKAYLIEGKRLDLMRQQLNAFKRLAISMQDVRESLATFEVSQRPYTQEAGTIRAWLEQNENLNFKEEFRGWVSHIEELGGKIPNKLRYKKLFADGPRVVEAAKKYMEVFEQQREAALAVEVQAWRDGGNNYKLPIDLRPLLRINKEDNTIETSWGASVPIEVAPALWAMVCNQRSHNADLPGLDIQVGSYTLEWVFSTGNIKVGCHIIQFSEIERMAVALGYITEEQRTCKQ